MFCPLQTGLLLVGIAEGIGLITTLIVDGVLQPLAVTFNVYVPEFAVVVLLTDGFCCVDVKAFGPVHANVTPVAFVATRFNVLPAQIGAFDESTAATGCGL